MQFDFNRVAYSCNSRIMNRITGPFLLQILMELDWPVLTADPQMQKFPKMCDSIFT